MLMQWTLCSCALLATSSALACFTVTSPADRVIYRSGDPPVDMSRPLHETLPRVFPQGHMVFDLETRCVEVAAAPGGAQPAAAETAAVVRVLSGPAGVLTANVVNAVVPTAALVADLGPRARVQ